MIQEATRGVCYYPYGETRWSSGTLPTDRRFTGQRYDSYTQLYHMGARWYDPVLARWTSPDSIVPDFSNPQSLNRCAYVYNNPLGYTDPDGHIPLPILLIFLAGVALTVNASTPLPPDRAPSTEQGVLGTLMMLYPAAAWALMTDGDPTNEVKTVTTALCGPDGCGDEAAIVGQEMQTAGTTLGEWVKTGDVDPQAEALAQKLGGQARFALSGDPARREFDAVSGRFIGQVTSRTGVGSSFRAQAKATFEVAKATGRSVYYRFLATPSQAMLDRLYEYGERYGVEVVIEVMEE